MTDEDRDRINVLMARMAAGDAAAPFALYQEFGHVVSAVMRRHLASLGTTVVPRHELDGLTMDACLELGVCARAWRPDGGALPWHWAGARLRALASRYVGTYADPLPDEWAERAAATAAGETSDSVGGAEPDAVALLHRLADGHRLAALLCDALERVASPRDRRILLEFTLQDDLGDPSPSHTLSAEHGLQPDAVRQVACRLRRRLRDLAAADERYAALGDLPLVA